MPRSNNRKPKIIAELAKGSDPVAVANSFGVTPSYVYHLNKLRTTADFAASRPSQPGQYPPPVGSLFEQQSVTSLRRHGGDVAEEYLRELQSAQGMQLYKEMGNHPIVSAVLAAVRMTLRRVQWFAVAPDSTRQEEVDFLDSCMADMSVTFGDFIDQSLSMLQYGFSIGECVYKLRKGSESRPGPKIPESRYRDGKIGWKKFEFIGQDTLAPGNAWIFDQDDGSLLGCNQLPPIGTIVSNLRQIPIPISIEKMVLFRTTTERNNPEGRSLLRAMYGPWYYARNMEEVEAISAERLGAGFPVFYLGEDISKGANADAEIHEYRKAGRNIRIDEQMNLVIPHAKMGSGMAREGTGVLFEFASPTNQSKLNFGEIIERHEKRMAMVGLAQFIHLGMGQFGAGSLAEVSTDFFQLAVSAWADSLRDTINRFAVMRLLKLNKMNIEDPILIDHSAVSAPDLKTVADFINKVVGAKVIEPDDQLESALRRMAAMPEKDPSTTRDVMVEVNGDGGTRTDRSGKTKSGLKQNNSPSANNQRNQNPKAAAPQKADKPQARQPMRASEETDTDEFAETQGDDELKLSDMVSILDFAEKFASRSDSNRQHQDNQAMTMFGQSLEMMRLSIEAGKVQQQQPLQPTIINTGNDPNIERFTEVIGQMSNLIEAFKSQPAPVVNVTVPESAAPQVNFTVEPTPISVNVESPTVQFNAPASAAPEIHIDVAPTPVNVTVEAPSVAVTNEVQVPVVSTETQVVKRDSQGRVERIHKTTDFKPRDKS